MCVMKRVQILLLEVITVNDDFIHFAIACAIGMVVFIAYICYEQYKYTRDYKHWLKHRYDK